MRDQFLPRNIVSGKRIVDVIQQNQLCIVNADLTVAVDIGSAELLRRQTAVDLCHDIHICKQRKLCILHADTVFAVYVTHRIYNDRRDDSLCCRRF